VLTVLSSSAIASRRSKRKVAATPEPTQLVDPTDARPERQNLRPPPGGRSSNAPATSSARGTTPAARPKPKAAPKKKVAATKESDKAEIELPGGMS
jgi:hypothetical protein